MSNTSFIIDKELNINGRGSLMKVLRELESNDLGTCIRQAMGCFKEINEAYIKAVSNDGKIIGSERSDILEWIDFFFDILILSWKSLDKYAQECTISIENSKHKMRLLIEEKNSLWSMTGRITPPMITPVKNFREIYGNKLAPQIIELLQTYREAVADRVIDDEEKDALRKGIRQILYYTLFLRLQLERCLINC